MMCFLCFFFQAEDGIRDLVRSRGLGDVYKRQGRWGGWAFIGSGAHENKPGPSAWEQSADNVIVAGLSLIHI